MTRAMRSPIPWWQAVAVALGFVLVVTLIAAVGSLAAGSAGSQYAGLARPSWLFGPVWTVLYLMIAFSGWRVWWSAGSWRAARGELLLFGVGLVLNAVWTPLFFAADARVLALADIVLLDLVVATTIVVFARRDRWAAGLLVPYLAWTVFATALNAAIVALN